jgi:hypothetical protein
MQFTLQLSKLNFAIHLHPAIVVFFFTAMLPLS